MLASHLHGLHGLNRLHRLHRLHRLGHVADPVLAFAHDFAGGRPWRRHRAGARSRREPSMLLLLLAGLAVFAFVKVMSVANNRRSTVEKVILGALLAVLGAVLLSFRRSSGRYR